MQQLTLPMRLRASSVFASFYAGSNARVVRHLLALDATRLPLVTFLYGERAVGKTHLLQALCAHVGTTQRRAAYLPLHELGSSADVLEGCEALDYVCLDDVDAVVGHAEWERALFRLYTLIDDLGGKLILASMSPPSATPFVLRDLASRLAAGHVERVNALSDEEQVSALTLRAEQLGLQLPPEVAQFLLRHLPRDMHSLCAALDQLDQASLASQRRLTLPMVRTALADRLIVSS
jgi:DnaA-homolog protein